MEGRLGHNALLTNNLANWISLTGAWHVMHIKKTNPDKPLYREIPIYDAEPTCCEIAKKEMNEYGFTISERTLFDSFNSIEKFYQLIGLAVN